MNVIDNLSISALKIFYSADHKGEAHAVEKMKKGELKAAVVEAVNYAATKYFISSLTVEQLAAAAEPLHLEEKKGDKAAQNVRSRNVLSKRISEAIHEEGLAAYLNKVETDNLKVFAERLDLEAKSAKAQLIEEIVEEVEGNGVQLYLESFTEDVLRDVAFDMKLEKDPTAAPGKNLLIEAIVTNEAVPKQEKKKKKAAPKVSKHKPELEKGVEYQDVFQHYYLEELVEFAKKNGIKTSGTKKELIKRIIAWLDGDKENTLSGTKKTPKRRKRSGSKKRASTGKKDAEGGEKAEAAAEPAESADDDGELDLDHLSKYTVAQLKKYCDEEALQVKGTKKKDYVDAITAYNAQEGS